MAGATLTGLAVAMTAQAAQAEPGWRCIETAKFEPGNVTTFLVGTKEGDVRLSFATYDAVLRGGTVSGAEIIKPETFGLQQPGVFSLKANVEDSGLRGYEVTMRVPGLARSGTPVPKATLQLVADGEVIAEAEREIDIPEEDYLDPNFQYSVDLTPVAAATLLSASSTVMQLEAGDGSILYSVSLPAKIIAAFPKTALGAMPNLKSRFANNGEDCAETEVF